MISRSRRSRRREMYRANPLRTGVDRATSVREFKFHYALMHQAFSVWFSVL
jgi:hypothetical protein